MTEIIKFTYGTNHANDGKHWGTFNVSRFAVCGWFKLRGDLLGYSQAQERRVFRICLRHYGVVGVAGKKSIVGATDRIIY